MVFADPTNCAPKGVIGVNVVATVTLTRVPGAIPLVTHPVMPAPVSMLVAVTTKEEAPPSSSPRAW
jgi:hypothetical protein